MAKFFNGSSIIDMPTSQGLAAGYAPIKIKQTDYPVPDCPVKYWKIVDGGVAEMSAAEKDAIDNPPPVIDPRIAEVDKAEAAGTFTADQAAAVRKILGAV